MKKVIFMIGLFLIPIQVNARTHIDMGEFKLTAYCPCEECSEGWGRQTASGKTAEAGRTIAVDPDIIDIGSKVKIGNKIYIAERILQWHYKVYIRQKKRTAPSITVPVSPTKPNISVSAVFLQKNWPQTLI